MHIQTRVPLAPHTTFHIGGEAEFFCEPATRDELKESLLTAKQNEWRVIILGGGSNILFGDGLIRGLVLSTKKLTTLREEEELLWVGAGVTMKDLNEWAIAHGRSGLEWSGGLPGTVGGATYMNARAYQHEMSEVVKAVKTIDFSGREFVLFSHELDYRYKHSVFMEHDDWVIVEIGVSLGISSPEEIRKQTDFYRLDREQKGQYAFPSAGCAFKNDYSRNLPAGQIIDEIGLKGHQIGGARVYERHANFIMNMGDATCEDVIKLLEEIEQKVYEKTGIRLEREVKVIR